MNLIVATDNNWAIGYKNDLLIKIPEDLKNFKKITTGHNVIMGRKTFVSLPGGNALPNRNNIVLTKDPTFNAKNIYACNNVDEVLTICAKTNNDSYVIGGEMIYRLFLPFCNKAYITRIYEDFLADKYFPNLDDDSDWIITNYSEVYENSNGIKFQFFEYNRNCSYAE